ncbi:MAG: hypothetical protein LBC77_01185 [Spirochaetaceae bacterium]|jgi:hypothetical protein|nr:hypothetical protein [Spirochaetaceae bacterium]
MTGYIILGAFVFFVVSVFGAYLAGRWKGRKAAKAEYEEDLNRKMKNEIEFEKAKAEIREEVFGNAEQKKAALSGGTAIERFNRINDSLRGKPAG